MPTKALHTPLNIQNTNSQENTAADAVTIQTLSFFLLGEIIKAQDAADAYVSFRQNAHAEDCLAVDDACDLWLSRRGILVSSAAAA